MAPDIGHLIIARRPGESFWIDDTEVIIHEVRHGGGVVVHVCAPKESIIVRTELLAQDELNRRLMRQGTLGRGCRQCGDNRTVAVQCRRCYRESLALLQGGRP